MEFRIMRVKRLEHLQYRADRLKADNIANVLTFFILLIIGIVIYARLLWG